MRVQKSTEQKHKHKHKNSVPGGGAETRVEKAEIQRRDGGLLTRKDNTWREAAGKTTGYQNIQNRPNYSTIPKGKSIVNAQKIKEYHRDTSIFTLH